MDAPKATAQDVGKALDALAALSVQLSCHCDVHPDTLILPAHRVREACSVIDEAVEALKHILARSVADGGGPTISGPV